MTSEVTLDGVVLDGVSFTYGMTLEAYEQALGPPTRTVMVGPPPPFGHRNNVLYFYDQLGLLLREHHATCLIQGLDLLLEPSRWHFPTTLPFSGILLVCGVRVQAGMAFREFATTTEVQFLPHLGHAWFVDGEKLSIQIEVYPKEQSGETVELISAVVVGFSGANRRGGESRSGRGG